VPLPLVTAGELAAARVAGIRLFTRVSTDVRRQVIATAKVPQADSTLEWFLSRVDTDVSGELVAPREPSVAAVSRAGVRPLVRRGLSRSVPVLPRLGRLSCSGGRQGRARVGLVDEVYRVRYLQEHALTELLVRVSPAGGRLG